MIHGALPLNHDKYWDFFCANENYNFSESASAPELCKVRRMIKHVNGFIGFKEKSIYPRLSFVPTAGGFFFAAYNLHLNMI